MASASQSSSQCATCLLVQFSVTSPLFSWKLRLCRPLNLGLSSSRLPLSALYSVPLLSVATFRFGISLSPSIRPSVQPRRFSPPCLLIWWPLSGRLGSPMLLLYQLLPGSWLQVGYVYLFALFLGSSVNFVNFIYLFIYCEFCFDLWLVLSVNYLRWCLLCVGFCGCFRNSISISCYAMFWFDFEVIWCNAKSMYEFPDLQLYSKGWFQIIRGLDVVHGCYKLWEFFSGSLYRVNGIRSRGEGSSVMGQAMFFLVRWILGWKLEMLSSVE